MSMAKYLPIDDNNITKACRINKMDQFKLFEKTFEI